MTRAEYEAKYGTPAPAKPAPVRMTRAEYDAKYNPKPKAVLPGLKGENAVSSVAKGITDFGVGVGSAIGKTGFGLGEAALKGAGYVAGKLGDDKGKKVLQDLAGGVKKISTAIYDQPQFLEARQSIPGMTGTGVGNIAAFVAPSSKVTKAQSLITKGVSAIPAVGKGAQVARGTLGILGRAVPEAVSAGGITLAQTGGDTEQAKRNALIGGGLSVGLGTAGAAYRATKSSPLASSFLSATSGIPKGATDIAQKFGVTKNATPEKALQDVRGGVREYRGMLSKFYDDGVEKVAETYKGTRTGLNENQIKQLTKVADEFGIDPKLIPQNLNSFSAKEGLSLMKALNEPKGLAVLASPKGSVLRALKDDIRAHIVKSFGGDEGAVASLLKDYSTKKQVLDAADDIVKAYNKKPTSAVTAKNKLMAIFDKNKPEYLKAITDLEEATGKNYTKEVASTKFSDIAPAGVLKADGGLPTQAGILDRTVRLAGLPVTSPRLVGKILSPSKPATELGKRLFGEPIQRGPINAATTSNIPNIQRNNVIPKNANIPVKQSKPMQGKIGGETLALGALGSAALFGNTINNKVGAMVDNMPKVPEIQSENGQNLDVPRETGVYIDPVRKVQFDDSDTEELKKILYSEVGNRSQEKRALEATVIINTALNRLAENQKLGRGPQTLLGVLTADNQYQGYQSKQYKVATTSEASPKKLAVIEEILTKLKNGELTDNTNGAFYYIHNPDGTITYDDKRKLYK